MTPQVRLATLGDLTALRLLWDALCVEQLRGYPTRTDIDCQRWTADTAHRLERQQAGEPGLYIGLAEDEETGMPLGFLAAWIESRRLGAPHHYWMIDHLYVIPAARALRVGQLLMHDGIARALALGINECELVALADDPQWARRGWEPTLTRYRTTITDMLARYPFDATGELPTPTTTAEKEPAHGRLGTE